MRDPAQVWDQDLSHSLKCSNPSDGSSVSQNNDNNTNARPIMWKRHLWALGARRWAKHWAEILSLISHKQHFEVTINHNPFSTDKQSKAGAVSYQPRSHSSPWQPSQNLNSGLPDQKLSTSSQPHQVGELLMENNPSLRAGSLNVTASHWMRCGGGGSNHPLGGFGAELYGGHQRLRTVRSQGDSSGCVAPGFQGPPSSPPHPTLPPPATLPWFLPAGQVWEWAPPLSLLPEGL